MVRTPLRRGIRSGKSGHRNAGFQRRVSASGASDPWPGDSVLVPNPSYPVHPYGFVIAGADVRHVRLTDGVDFFAELESAILNNWPKPKVLVLNFPGNPTTHCVELEFFERVVAIAKAHGIWVVQDLAYADIVFDAIPRHQFCRSQERWMLR